MICRRLGIEYLWIDALCVIQDSPTGNDWVEQSAVMDEIYGNAAITLAAAAASSVWDGILVETKEPASGSFSMPFNLDLVGSVLKTIPGSNPTIRFYPYEMDAKQALASRAWAFQEYAMSNRVLSYQKEQIVWECKTKKVYMNGPLNVRQLQIQKSWEECVQQYTACDLTFENDRLMALSGFARLKYKEYKATGVQNTYLAGLWQNELLDHLHWVSTIKPPPTRPKFYRAPTWSWASINGPIEYVTRERKGSMNRDIKFISVFLATSPLNLFGTLNGSPVSYLYLEGFLKAIPEMEIPSKDAPLSLGKKFRRDMGKSWWIEFDVIDVQQRIEEALELANEEDIHLFAEAMLYCFRLTEFTALILVRVAKKGEMIGYERVGIVRHWYREPWHWFDDVREQTGIYWF
jgi:hypothetical protein